MDTNLTICIPAYNASDYIEKTIQSLLRQTYNNFLIIVGDNASTDETAEIIEHLAKKENRIKLIRNPYNLGFADNINNLASKAETPYIAIFHADDIYGESIIEKELAVLSTNKYGAVFSKLESFYSTDAQRTRRHPLHKKLRKFARYNEINQCFEINSTECVDILVSHGNIFACPTLMCERSFFLQCGGFRSDYPTVEDIDLWIRFAKAGKTLAIIDDYQFRYRVHEKQGSAIDRKHTKLPEFYRLLEETVDFSNLNNKSISSFQERKALEYLYISQTFTDPQERKKMITASRKCCNCVRFSKMWFLQHFPWILNVKINIIKLVKRLLY